MEIFYLCEGQIFVLKVYTNEDIYFSDDGIFRIPQYAFSFYLSVAQCK